MWVSKLTGNIEWERHAVNACGITDGAVGPDAAKSKSNAHFTYCANQQS